MRKENTSHLHCKYQVIASKGSAISKKTVCATNLPTNALSHFSTTLTYFGLYRIVKHKSSHRYSRAHCSASVAILGLPEKSNPVSILHFRSCDDGFSFRFAVGNTMCLAVLILCIGLLFTSYFLAPSTGSCTSQHLKCMHLNFCFIQSSNI